MVGRSRRKVTNRLRKVKRPAVGDFSPFAPARTRGGMDTDTLRRPRSLRPVLRRVSSTGRRALGRDLAGRLGPTAGVWGGVGSNVTQPNPSNQASTQEWASVSRTIHSPVDACQPGLSGVTQQMCAPLVSGAEAVQSGRSGPSDVRSVGWGRGRCLRHRADSDSGDENDGLRPLPLRPLA